MAFITNLARERLACGVMPTVMQETSAKAEHPYRPWGLGRKPLCSWSGVVRDKTGASISQHVLHSGWRHVSASSGEPSFTLLLELYCGPILKRASV